jgi:hypothetical protein
MKFQDTKYCTLWIEDGILFIKYKEGVVLNIEAARIVVDAILLLLNGAKLPCYCDITGLKEADKMARDFISQSVDKFLTKLAFITGNNVSNVIGGFFIEVNKPPIQTRVFTDKQSALEFLRS